MIIPIQQTEGPWFPLEVGEPPYQHGFSWTQLFHLNFPRLADAWMESNTFPWAKRWVLMASSGCWALLGLGLGPVRRLRRGRVRMERERERMEKLPNPRRHNSYICFHQSRGIPCKVKGSLQRTFTTHVSTGLVSPSTTVQRRWYRRHLWTKLPLFWQRSWRRPTVAGYQAALTTSDPHVISLSDPMSNCEKLSSSASKGLRIQASADFNVSRFDSAVESLLSQAWGLCWNPPEKINNKCDKNKHYAAVIAEANHSKFKTSQEIGFNFNFNASVHPSSVGSFVPIYFAVLRPQSSFPLNPLLLAFSVGAQVNQLTEIARERIELAKALIKAVDKPKAKAKAAPGPTPDPTKGTGDQGEASA